MKLQDFATDPGIGWHLKTGEWISTNFQIPEVDPFLFSTIGKKWIPDQWLADLILYYIYEVGSWPLVYSLLTLIYLYTFVYSLSSKIIYLNSGGILTSLIVLFGFFWAQIHFIMRPVLFSFLFFQIIYLEFLKILQHEKATKTSYLKIFLVAILWVNSHPSYLLLWVIFAFLVLAKLFTKSSLIVTVKECYPIFLLLLVASCCSPNALSLFNTVLELGVTQFNNPSYKEWQSPDLTLWGSLLFSLPWILCLIITYKKRLTLDTYVIFQLLCCLFLTICSLRAARFLPYYAIVIVPLFHLTLMNVPWSRNLSWKKLLAESWTNLEMRQSLKSDGRILFSLSAILLILYSLSFNKVPFYQGTLGPKDRFHPQLISYLLNENSALKEIKILNSVNYGGYLTGWGKGKIKAYIDDRTTLHGLDFYKELEDNWKPNKIERFALKQEADYIMYELIEQNQELTSYFKSFKKNSIVFINSEVILIDVQKLHTNI